jgi:hypothetical protein
MGHLTYDSHLKITFTDRMLAHLQVAIAVKLHSREGFLLSWHSDKNGDGGRSAIWIHPEISLAYKFTDQRRPTLNPAWVEALVRAANTPEGMSALPEPLPAGTPYAPAAPHR